MDLEHLDERVNAETEPEQMDEGTEGDALSEKTWYRWRRAYEKVFGEVDSLFEERVQKAALLLKEGRARSREMALRSLQNLPPVEGGGPEGSERLNGRAEGSKRTMNEGAERSPNEQSERPEHGLNRRPERPERRSNEGTEGPERSKRKPNERTEQSEQGPNGRSERPERPNEGTERSERPNGGKPERPEQSERSESERSERPQRRMDERVNEETGRKPNGPEQAQEAEGTLPRGDPRLERWHRAYREVFGEEPVGPLSEARIRAGMRLYRPEQGIGRRQALETVKQAEEEATGRMGELGPTEKSNEEGGPTELPMPDEEGLALWAVLIKLGRLEAEVERLGRTVARLEERIHRTETRLGGLVPGLQAIRGMVRGVQEGLRKLEGRVEAEGGKDQPPPAKEIRELRARMDEERGRILLEVERRIEEMEELLRRSFGTRIEALESWVRRVSRYLGLGKKGGLFGR